MVKNLYIVTPRGFCAGVEMAIKALTWMLKIYDETIYCYHEIVHNDWIVERFKNKNIKFIESTEELPEKAVLMLSAHGTAPDVENQFSSISSIQVNAVCPLVTKVHHEAKKFTEAGQKIIYVGHKNHDEAIGALGVAPESMFLVEKKEDLDQLDILNEDVALLAQTTLAMSEWEPIMDSAREKYPELNMPRKSDLCYATTNRQEAVINVSSFVDVVLVVGSDTSSNTKALVSTIQNLGKESYRVNTTQEIDSLDLYGKNVAVTAGASAPDHIVQEIIKKLEPEKTEFFENTNETEYFPLPKELRSNITSVSNFLLSIFPDNNVEPIRSINKDRQWSATDALSSL